MTFEVEFSDGSVFRMPHPDWERALWMKYPKEREGEVKAAFKEAVESLWRERRVVTKYGEMSWEEFFESEAEHFGLEGRREFENMAELAEVVMYTEIRAPLMGLVLHEAGGGRVVALTEEGVRYYPVEEDEEVREEW